MIKPFHFNLAKISKAQIGIVEGLLEFLPATGLRETLNLAVRKALNKYLPDVRYYVESVTPTAFRDFFAALPHLCTVGVLGMEPFREKGFVEIDPVLSHLAITKLLGGKSEEMTELRSLTETEQGVIEFLLLKLLSQIHKLGGESVRLHFRLEQMVMEPAHLKQVSKDDFPLVCIRVHVAFLNRSGFVKIFLPHPWVMEGFLKDLPGDKKGEAFKEIKKNLKNFDTIPVRLKGVLGEAEVEPGDIQNLEEGDVVLFDETELVKKRDGIRGEVKIVAGDGESGGLTALWEGFADKGRCKITGGRNG